MSIRKTRAGQPGTGQRLLAGLRPMSLTGLLLAAAAGAAVASPPAAQPESTTAAAIPADERQASGTEPQQTFIYKNIAGSAFQSRAATSGFGGGSPGCAYLTSNSPNGRLEHKVLLPEGAVVKYLRIYYKDSSAADLKAWLTEYDGAGQFEDVTEVGSSGAAGFGSALSPEMNYSVDHYSKALTVVVDTLAALDGTLQFCGARIAYYDSPKHDVIFKNGFD